jgi:hypothetical protein
MAEATDRYALPLLQSGQSQKEITHNEALIRMDALLHLAVESRALASPPSAPEPGRCWIVAADPTGAWAGQAGRIAQFHAGGWSFIAPADGGLAWVKDEGVFAYFAGGAWRADAWPVKKLQLGGATMLTVRQAAIANPAGGATVDAEARAAIGQVLAALRGHGLIEN